MGLNLQDSMAIVNIVASGIAIIGYTLIANSSESSTASHKSDSYKSASHKKTTSYRNSVGGKTRRRR
jgi:hypothetical protein